MVEINTSLQHHFLIAMPSLVDTFFYRTVIYICEHDDQGAMGIIINRPTQITLTELLSHFEISNSSKTSNNTPVFFGGPVEKNQGMVLHNSNTAWKNTIQLAESLKAEGFEIDRKNITIKEDLIKEVGSYSATVKLHRQVSVEIPFDIVAE